MKKSIAAGMIAALSLLAACSKAPSGVYEGQAVIKGAFETKVFNYALLVEGEKGIILTDKRSRRTFSLTVRHDDGRLVMKDEGGTQLAFTVKNNAKTLECAQCGAFEMPTVWEKGMTEADDRVAHCRKAMRAMVVVAHKGMADAGMDTTGRGTVDEEAEKMLTHPRDQAYFRACVFGREQGHEAAQCLINAKDVIAAKPCLQALEKI